VICAFCGAGIEEAGLNPCALMVVSGWAGPEDDQLEQQLFTHAECLRSRLHPDVAAHADVLGPPTS
jgi:hypothetical protein